MFRARRFAATTTALLLITGGFFAALFPAVDARAQSSPQGSSSSCEDAAGLAVLPSPIAPWTGMPLRVMFVTEKALDGELMLIAPNGAVAAKSSERKGGPPYFWFAEVATPGAGTWHGTLSLGCGTITRDFTVSAQKPPGPPTPEGSVWQLRNSWNRATENLYSAWVAKLFDAPPDQDLSWKAWHEVLRDRSRNLLFNYLGLGEDNVAVSLRPDCADFVYFLRAYFAFKMGLLFGYSNCSRGTGGAPPKCYQWFDILHPEITRPAPPPEQTAASIAPAPADTPNPNLLQKMFAQPSAPPAPAPAAAASPKRLGLAPSFARYLRDVGDVVHTGSVRVAATDDNTDFYTVPLTQHTLRPGTVYADPYGHVLMLVQRLPEVNGTPGVFLAVDAEPDGTVTRKRFWRGNFLFAHEPALGSPGFKRFRPIVREANGSLRRLTNAEIAKNPQYGDFALDQSRLSVEDFYDRMDEVMSPEPLDPSRAMTDAITSLEEQVNTRVTAVENGRKFQSSGRGDADMPNGPSIFETNGPWEDFSTPARDFRLLIAIDVVRGFPDHVARLSERYTMPQGESVAEVKTQLQGALASELASRKVTYTRSDGSPWTLTLKDVVDRSGDFEMAYNPNDCVELRWGARDGSDEASTCKRHAPAAQRAKMADYRAWFRERHWPTHTGT
ncbi:MAG TPA: hypothetical protein VE396_16130 [Xanthobacteraceae bacterium]|nr:hypothetical protein [Xanthobacteraceae bacterium]